jgi:hypothetical protein
LYESVTVLFLTEFNNIVPLATNIKERMIKNTMFREEGNSTPLYEEKSTMFESNNTRTVKIKMKINEVFLFRVKPA